MEPISATLMAIMGMLGSAGSALGSGAAAAGGALASGAGTAASGLASGASSLGSAIGSGASSIGNAFGSSGAADSASIVSKLLGANPAQPGTMPAPQLPGSQINTNFPISNRRYA